MAQTYIVGDIVVYKNRIHTIIDTLGLNNYELSYIRNPVNRAELSGVPLTPEILEKNGWRKEEENYFNDSYHIFLECNYEKYSAYKVVHNNVVWLRDVRSVSDLQHLLYGLEINHEMEV